MKIDVVKYGVGSIVSLASVHSFTYFKKNYSHWFRTVGELYIRYVGKDLVGTWRYLPNRSIEFYRCKKVTSQDFLDKLNKDFVENIISDFKE